MSVPNLSPPTTRSFSSEAAGIGGILLGAAGGAAVGLLAGALAFDSLVTALLGGLGGAIAGMIVPARAAEGGWPERADEE
jgi:hypothetical protein